MKYMCPKEHLFKASSEQIVEGYQCPHCVKTNKTELFRVYLERKGLKLKENQRVTALTKPVVVICEVGHEFGVKPTYEAYFSFV